MIVLNVYEQYFFADAVVNGIPRHAVIAALQAESCDGKITYRIFLNFFPYNSPDDFVETFDARVEKTVYEAKGRRSRKREEKFLAAFREEADKLAGEIGATVFWERPIGKERKA